MFRSLINDRFGNGAAGNLLMIVVALLLAGLSVSFGQPSAREAQSLQPISAPAIHSAPAVQQELALAPRGLFAEGAAPHQVRRYQPGFETSDSAGALGFWILVSLCALLLSAAAAPSLLQRVRRGN